MSEVATFSDEPVRYIDGYPIPVGDEESSVLALSERGTHSFSFLTNAAELTEARMAVQFADTERYRTAEVHAERGALSEAFCTIAAQSSLRDLRIVDVMNGARVGAWFVYGAGAQVMSLRDGVLFDTSAVVGNHSSSVAAFPKSVQAYRGAIEDYMDMRHNPQEVLAAVTEQSPAMAKGLSRVGDVEAAFLRKGELWSIAGASVYTMDEDSFAAGVDAGGAFMLRAFHHQAAANRAEMVLISLDSILPS